MTDLPDQDISLLQVHNEKELGQYNLDALAMELTGSPVPRMFPIYLVFHHGRVKGYFQAIEQTCIYPTIHPDSMGPKEYVKIMKSLVTEIKRAVGNPIFMACKRADVLSENTMKAIGVKRSEESAYVYYED